MNTITMTRRLTRDAELRHLSQERAVAKMRIPLDNGRLATTFIDVDAFDGQAYA